MLHTKHISYLILVNPDDSPERQLLACLHFTAEKWYYCLTKDNQQVASSGFEFHTFLYSMLKSRDITLPTKVRLVKASFPSSHVWMWELDHKEGWMLKNWCFWTVMLEKTLESPLPCKEIQPVSTTGNWSWIFIGRTDAEAESPVLWPPNSKSQIIRKDPDAGKDWRQEKKRTVKWLDGTTDSMDMSFSKLLLLVKDREAWRVAVHVVAKCQTWLSNLTTTFYLQRPFSHTTISLRDLDFLFIEHLVLLKHTKVPQAWDFPGVPVVKNLPANAGVVQEDSRCQLGN